uniref:Uncharacterized protein n=2 Tax=Picea TaxID=3328 RepID=A0A101LX72_PICGL|nr:hypothetical protein ABT39_MTgene6000 [Picea glauca]QHR91451.1 hypothetical protein Q903MT_gene5485 [Picea sitchensis]
MDGRDHWIEWRTALLHGRDRLIGSDGLIGTMSPGGWDGGRLYRMAGIA